MQGWHKKYRNKKGMLHSEALAMHESYNTLVFLHAYILYIYIMGAVADPENLFWMVHRKQLDCARRQRKMAFSKKEESNRTF